MNGAQHLIGSTGPPGPPPVGIAPLVPTSPSLHIGDEAELLTPDALPWQRGLRVFIGWAFESPKLGALEDLPVFNYYRETGPYFTGQAYLLVESKGSECVGDVVSAWRQAWDEEPREEQTLKALEQAYVLEDRSSVSAFIQRNRLLEFLLEAREPLAAAFGQETVKKLTVVEDDEGRVALLCLILVSGNLGEARRALDSFDENWWLARSGKHGGKLNFDFDLV